MNRIIALLAVLACAAVVSVLPAAAADGPVKTYSQDVTLGFFRGQVISYLDFGPVRLARGNRIAPIWAFTNGHENQRNVIDTVPGMRTYTPLWAVRMVTWRSGMTPRVLRSAAAIRAAQRSGQVAIANAPVVVNCPVL
jgi:hypothetical protein